MKATVNRKEFQKKWEIVRRAVARGVQAKRKPILGMVKITAGGGGIELTATDLELSIKVWVDATSVVPGSMLIPAAGVSAFLKTASGDWLNVATADGLPTLTAESGRAKFPTMDAADFPGVDVDSTLVAGIDVDGLIRQIGRTAYATDTESSRYALGGAKLELDGDTLRLIATDGRRMAVAEQPAARVMGDTDLSRVIWPVRAMKAAAASLKGRGKIILSVLPTTDAPKESKETYIPGWIVLSAVGVEIAARQLGGRFPRWDGAFPAADFGQRIELPVGPTLAAVKQVAAATDDESRGIDFAFTAANLHLAAKSESNGESAASIGPVDAQPVEITLDPRFVADFLATLAKGEMATLQVRDHESPAVFHAGPDYRYVVGPLVRDRNRAAA